MVRVAGAQRSEVCSVGRLKNEDKDQQADSEKPCRPRLPRFHVETRVATEQGGDHDVELSCPENNQMLGSAAELRYWPARREKSPNRSHSYPNTGRTSPWHVVREVARQVQIVHQPVGASKVRTNERFDHKHEQRSGNEVSEEDEP